MGRDKAFLKIREKSLLQLALEKAHALRLPHRVLSGKRPIKGVDCLLDSEGEGPLAGLYAALQVFERVLIIPVDTPFLPMGLLETLLEEGEMVDILVCEINGRVQPQVGTYKRSCLLWIEQAFTQGDWSLKGLLNRPLRRRVLRHNEVAVWGDPELMFFNINTPEDLETAEMITGKGV